MRSRLVCNWMDGYTVFESRYFSADNCWLLLLAVFLVALTSALHCIFASGQWRAYRQLARLIRRRNRHVQLQRVLLAATSHPGRSRFRRGRRLSLRRGVDERLRRNICCCLCCWNLCRRSWAGDCSPSVEFFYKCVRKRMAVWFQLYVWAGQTQGDDANSGSDWGFCHHSIDDSLHIRQEWVFVMSQSRIFFLQLRYVSFISNKWLNVCLPFNAIRCKFENKLQYWKPWKYVDLFPSPFAGWYDWSIWHAGVLSRVSLVRCKFVWFKIKKQIFWKWTKLILMYR